MYPTEATLETATLPTLDDCMAEGLCLTCCRELTGHGSYCTSRCARVAATTKQRWLWSDESVEAITEPVEVVSLVEAAEPNSQLPPLEVVIAPLDAVDAAHATPPTSATRCHYCGDKATKSCTRCHAIVCATCCSDDGHCPSCNDPTLVLRPADFVYLTDVKLPAEIHLHGDGDVTVSDGAATSGSTQHFDGLDEFCDCFGVSVVAVRREIEAVRVARGN